QRHLSFQAGETSRAASLGVCKSEVVRRGPWRNIDAVATLDGGQLSDRLEALLGRAPPEFAVTVERGTRVHERGRGRECMADFASPSAAACAPQISGHVAFLLKQESVIGAITVAAIKSLEERRAPISARDRAFAGRGRRSRRLSADLAKRG